MLFLTRPFSIRPSPLDKQTAQPTTDAMTSNAVTTRIMKEVQVGACPGATPPTTHPQRLSKDPLPGIGVTQEPTNLRYFLVQMAGPKDTPYEGGVFKLELYLPEEYPMVGGWGVCQYPPVPAEGPLHDAHLPPEHRQARTHLPGHPQGQVVPRRPDPSGAPLRPGGWLIGANHTPGPALVPERRRPAGHGGGRHVEEEPRAGARHRPRLDQRLRQGGRQGAVTGYKECACGS